jgi:hypothetical protein
MWGRPLSSTQAGRATGRVTAFHNDERLSGDPRSIKLAPHAVIQRRPPLTSATICLA